MPYLPSIRAQDRDARALSEAPSVFGFLDSFASAGTRLQVVLLQFPETPEGFAVGTAIRLHDLPVSVIYGRTEQLAEHQRALRSGACLPIGTLPFMQAAMGLAGVRLPGWSACPAALHEYVLNRPRRMAASSAVRMRQPVFVRPLDATAGFSEFLLQPEMGEHDQRQMHALSMVAPNELVEVTPALDVVAEWRFYVLAGEVVGYAPCPPTTPDGPCPRIEDVSAIVAAIPQEAVYAMDLGVLREGGSSLMRVHDPLNMELIPVGTERPSQLSFLCMVWTRWLDLRLPELSSRALAA